jgi:UDP:flavonoid glycosyltransferase YjiC (YdhE family)
MKILVASTPATGHLNPLLATGRILIAEGHAVVRFSGKALRGHIEGIGAEFRPLPAGADFRSATHRLGGSRAEEHASGAGMVAGRDRARVRPTVRHFISSVIRPVVASRSSLH